MKLFNLSRRYVRALLLVVLTVGALPLEAQPLETQKASATREPRIGLVLGGGGARGAAHIGVLKVLEREHIPIHAVAGTSVGAVIGGLYAAGYSPTRSKKPSRPSTGSTSFRDVTSRPMLPMRQKETDLGILANLEVGLVDGQLAVPTTLVRGQKLGLFLRRMFLGRSNVASFDDLPIPFRCVATDIGVVKPVVFSSGDLELAIRASMAVPGAFAPVQHEGKVLVDGGIVDNLPVDIARQMDVDYVIVVDVGRPLCAGQRSHFRRVDPAADGERHDARSDGAEHSIARARRRAHATRAGRAHERELSGCRRRRRSRRSGRHRSERQAAAILGERGSIPRLAAVTASPADGDS